MEAVRNKPKRTLEKGQSYPEAVKIKNLTDAVLRPLER